MKLYLNCVIETKCLYCAVEFEVRKAKFKKTGNYCSRLCFNKFRIPYRKGIWKKCKICDMGFYVTPNRISAKFCSQRCNAQNKKNLIQLLSCLQCGKTFRPKRRSQKFCSNYCNNANQLTSEVIACKLCGKKFLEHKSKLKQASHFCSAEHAIKWSRRNQVLVSCKVCGKQFSISKSSAKKRLCCSRACLGNLTINNFEQKCYDLLDKLNILYFKQHKVEKFTVDAYIPDSKLVVEFDGDYWHGNPKKYFKFDKIQQKHIIHDQNKNSLLSEKGYKVVRLWESDVKSDENYLKRCIQDIIDK